MTGSLAVLTPSYGPDLEQFRELRATVERFVPDAQHYAVVPAADIAAFSSFAGVDVIDETTLVPGTYRRTGVRGWWVDVRRPWWPVRGWVLQQALKIAASAALDHDQVLIADSDIAFVRPFRLARHLDLPDEGAVRAALGLVRREDAVHAGMPRHVRWHAVARDLLGLPREATLPQPDYVSSLNLWSPRRVREMTERIERTTGTPWFDAVARQRHVSEFTLYGVFLDNVVRDPDTRIIPRWSCDYWDEDPLDAAAADRLVQSMTAVDAALMISAKSRTPATVRERAIDAAQARARTQETA